MGSEPHNYFIPQINSCQKSFQYIDLIIGNTEGDNNVMNTIHKFTMFFPKFREICLADNMLEVLESKYDGTLSYFDHSSENQGSDSDE